MKDIFKPSTEPAASIYEAFQKEAKKRGQRTVDHWISAERDAVYREAVYQARTLGLRIPLLEDVIKAEESACGHCDYGAKWARGVVDAMYQH